MNVFARAQAVDTFTFYTIPGNNYKSKYLFHLDGLIAGTNAYGNLNFQAGSNSYTKFTFESTGPIGLDLSTPSWDVQDGVSFTSQTNFTSYFNPFFDNLGEDGTEGEKIAGTSNFSSTLTLAGIELVDANDNPVSGWGFTSASGTNYNLIGGHFQTFSSAVPEPGVTALLVAGLCSGGMMFFKRTRRSSAKS